MEARIVDFCRLLREHGVRVSLAETMDGLRALECVGLGDRETVRAALRTATVKRQADLDTFEPLFDSFFSGLGELARRLDAETAESLEVDPAELERMIAELEALAKELGIELSELAQAVLQGDAGRIERLLRDAAGRAGVDQIQHGFQEGRHVHALAMALGVPALGAEFDQMREGLGNRDDDETRRLRGLLDRRLQELTELMKALVRQELERRDATRRDRRNIQSLAEKSFFYLTEEEIRRMQEAVTGLARRLKNVVSLRRRKARRGTFDSSATLRKNLQYGGVPFRIVFDRRRREKPQIVVLCDVSDSVRNVSRFMLQFVYSLQDLYTKVRSFVFVADVGEVTETFKEKEIHVALDEALRGDVINVYAHSDFGRAFRAFHRDHLSAINKRTTVIILGDARNNYNLPHEWVLRDVQQRAKQLIWLNPENHMTWGFGDSEMDRYAPFCTVVEECRNLSQLYRVIDRLVAT